MVRVRSIRQFKTDLHEIISVLEKLIEDEADMVDMYLSDRGGKGCARVLATALAAHEGVCTRPGK